LTRLPNPCSPASRHFPSRRECKVAHCIPLDMDGSWLLPIMASRMNWSTVWTSVVTATATRRYLHAMASDVNCNERR
jgi:hypothetical protein